MKLYVIAFIFIITQGLFSSVFAQRNWHHKDPKKDKLQGISTDRTYAELLKGRTSKTVIVAIIDSGVDTTHEDLKGKFWINKKEIPGNGIDDDNNGYIDDIYGWSFLGNTKGENINHETLELTRVYREFTKKYKNLIFICFIFDRETGTRGSGIPTRTTT